MSHSRSVDGCLEDACDTGVLQLSGKSLRNYPIANEEEAPFNHKDILELGKNVRVTGGVLFSLYA